MTENVYIEEVMNKYTDGTRSRDLGVLKSIFHSNAVMTGWMGSDLLVGSPQPFYDALQTHEVGADYASQITDISIDGPIASAEVREQNLFGLDFVNRCHLIRQSDGSWLIVSKLFRHL